MYSDDPTKRNAPRLTRVLHSTVMSVTRYRSCRQFLFTGCWLSTARIYGSVLSSQLLEPSKDRRAPALAYTWTWRHTFLVDAERLGAYEHRLLTSRGWSPIQLFIRFD